MLFIRDAYMHVLSMNLIKSIQHQFNIEMKINLQRKLNNIIYRKCLHASFPNIKKTKVKSDHFFFLEKSEMIRIRGGGGTI